MIKKVFEKYISESKSYIQVTIFLLIIAFPVDAQTPEVVSIAEIDYLSQQLIALTSSYNIGSSAAVELKTLAEKRRMLMRLLLKQNPQAFFSSAMTTEKRNLLPANIKPYVEQFVTIRGNLKTIHVDNFDVPENSYHEHFIKQGNLKYKIHEKANLFPHNSEIEISGYRLDSDIVPNFTLFPAKLINETSQEPTLGPQKLLVFMVYYEDSDVIRPFTKDHAEELLFRGRIQEYLAETTHGNISLTGTVLDWAKIPRNPRDDCALSMVTNDELSQIALNKGIRMGDYSRILILDDHSCFSHSWSTLGRQEEVFGGVTYNVSLTKIHNLKNFNVPDETAVWSKLDATIAHELGHAFGITHASSRVCPGGNNLYGSCAHREYGNNFDIMGSAKHAVHYNAFSQDILNVIPDTDIITINRSGTYRLKSLESHEGKRIAKIVLPNSTTTVYYLEFRKPIGFDRGLGIPPASGNTGLFVNRVYHRYFLPQVQLIDADADSSFDVVTINPGKTFTDSLYGITVDAVSLVGSNEVVFNVSVPPTQSCRRVAPLEEYRYNIDSYYRPGSTVRFGVRYLNENNPLCPPAEYDLKVTHPDDWIVTFVQNNRPVAYGKLYYSYIEIQIPWNANDAEIILTTTERVSGKSSKATFNFNVERILGDVYPDGKITTEDAIRTLQIATNIVKATATDFKAADVNRDGVVNGADVLLINGAVSGINKLPNTSYPHKSLEVTKKGMGSFSAINVSGGRVGQVLAQANAIGKMFSLGRIDTPSYYSPEKVTMAFIPATGTVIHSITGCDSAALDICTVTVNAVRKVVVNVTGDTVALPPKINITYPQNNTVVSGSVNIQTNVSSNVVRVDFFRNNTILMGSDYAAPFTLSWAARNHAVGSQHTLKAKATNSAGVSTMSVPVLVTIGSQTLTTNSSELTTTVSKSTTTEHIPTPSSSTASGTNILTNGNFESGQTTWSGWGTNIKLSSEYNSAKALEIVHTSGTRTLNDSSAKTVFPNTQYLVSAWIKNTGTTNSDIVVEIEWRTSGGSTIKKDFVSYTGAQTDWTEISRVITSPANAAKMRIRLKDTSTASGGSTFFDEVSVQTALSTQESHVRMYGTVLTGIGSFGREIMSMLFGL